jgi:hypothetical protein
MEIVAGVGVFGGPLIGAVFNVVGEYTFVGGYQLPFYVLALICMTCLLMIYRYLSLDVNS